MRCEAIGTRFEMRKFRFDAQQPLEYAWTINDFIAIQLLAKHHSPGSWLKGEDGLFFNKQLTICQLADFPHTCRCGNTEHHD